MNKLLLEELKTWNIEDPIKRAEKIERERVRYPKMLKEMGINFLDLEEKIVVDVGSGPISALQFIEAKEKIAIDPLISEYQRFHQLNSKIKWINAGAESMPFASKFCDLIICMNALDHFEEPLKVIKEVIRILRAGGFFAVHCCINNATNNPHPAHIHNINYELFRSWVDGAFETVHEFFGRYGWKKYRGKVGQSCFGWLGRKVSDY